MVVDRDGNVVDELLRPTPQGVGAIADLVAESVSALAACGLPVGVGAPVLMDAKGVVVGAPNLASVIGENLREAIAERLSSIEAPLVAIDNDATCAAVGELCLGAARSKSYAAVVTLGTGIGAGLIVEGKVVRGANGLAGEAGHMIVDPSGPPCPCGRQGCWERYASGTGLARMARDAAHAGRARRVVELAGGDPEAVRGEHVSLACREADAQALEIMSNFGWWVALGLVNMVLLLDLSLCILGGGPIASGDLLLGPVRAHFAELMAYGSSRPPVAIEPAGLGPRAGAVGAAWMALQAS